jgi:hypothetical protein
MFIIIDFPQMLLEEDLWKQENKIVLLFCEKQCFLSQIQALEQAQEQLPDFNFQEAPNKVLPPPGQTSRSPLPPIHGVSHKLVKKLDFTKDPLFIPSTVEELTLLTLKAISYLHNELTFSGDVEHKKVLSICYDRNSVNMRDIKRSSRRIFKKLVFDLTRDLMKGPYGSTREKPNAPWDWPTCSHKRSKLLPGSKEMLQDIVLKQVLGLFGFTHKSYKEKFVIQWSRKERDYVDEILMKESHEEESAWTDYEEDEVTVKNEIALGILVSLLDETVQVIKDIRKTKHKKSYELIILT